MTTENFNVYYFVLNIFIFVIYSVLSLVYLKRNCKNSSVLKLEPILMLTLLFLAMQISINAMYRYIYALSPYIIIFVAQYLMEFSNNTSSLKKSLSYFRSFVIISPLLASFVYSHNPFTYPSFNPYSSVIEKSFDGDREKFYETLTHYGNRYQKNRDYY